MSKRPRFFLLTEIILLLLIVTQALYFVSMPSQEKRACPFDEPSVIERQQIEGGNHVRVLYNWKPMYQGHILIIPKRHVERVEDLNAEEWAEMHSTIQKMHRAFQQVYGANDYVLILQNGKNAGQTVPHMHFHMLPRKDDNVLEKLRIWWALLTRPLTLMMPLNDEQLQQEIVPLKTAEAT